MNEYYFSRGVDSWSVESCHRLRPTSTDTGHGDTKSSATDAGAESSHGERSATAGHANAIYGKVLLISYLLQGVFLLFLNSHHLDSSRGHSLIVLLKNMFSSGEIGEGSETRIAFEKHLIFVSEC